MSISLRVKAMLMAFMLACGGVAAAAMATPAQANPVGRPLIVKEIYKPIDYYLPGDPIEFTIRVKNIQGATELKNVVVKEEPDNNFESIEFYSPSQGQPDNDKKVWKVGDISRDVTPTIKVRAKLKQQTLAKDITFTNTVRVKANGKDYTTGACSDKTDFNDGDTSQCDIATGTIRTPPTLTKTLVKEGKPGEYAEWKLQVDNKSGARYTSVTVMDMLPSQVEKIENPVASAGTFDAKSNEWHVGIMAPNSSATMTFKTKVKADAKGEIVNKAKAKYSAMGRSANYPKTCNYTEKPSTDLCDQASYTVKYTPKEDKPKIAKTGVTPYTKPIATAAAMLVAAGLVMVAYAWRLSRQRS